MIKELIARLKHRILQSPLWVIVGLIGLLKNAQEMGYINSLWTKRAIDKDGHPLPWYSYPSIDWIKDQNLKDKNIFEWGSGYSSLFYLNKGARLTSVEDYKVWFDEVKLMANKYKKKFNFLFSKDKASYLNAIKKLGIKYHIIVIDGSHRQECVKLAPKYLRNNGLIIIDNSNRYPESVKYLENQGFKPFHFKGLGPVDFRPWTTTIFFKIDSKQKKPLFN